jgi:hypothetical protein
MSAFNKQEGGSHYTKCKIQPFQYSMANGLDPMQHTIIKYVTRFRDKGGVADLKKAIHTLELLIEHEGGQKPEVARTCWGLPFPVGTPRDVIHDLQDIADPQYGGRSLPKDRYDAAQALSEKQATLARGMLAGEVPVSIIARTYEEAQALARRHTWPIWTYFPQSSNLKGVAGRVFVVYGTRLADTTLADLIYLTTRNIVFQLD